MKKTIFSTFSIIMVIMLSIECKKQMDVKEYYSLMIEEIAKKDSLDNIELDNLTTDLVAYSHLNRNNVEPLVIEIPSINYEWLPKEQENLMLFARHILKAEMEYYVDKLNDKDLNALDIERLIFYSKVGDFNLEEYNLSKTKLDSIYKKVESIANENIISQYFTATKDSVEKNLKVNLVFEYPIYKIKTSNEFINPPMSMGAIVDETVYVFSDLRTWNMGPPDGFEKVWEKAARVLTCSADSIVYEFYSSIYGDSENPNLEITPEVDGWDHIFKLNLAEEKIVAVYIRKTQS